MIVKIYKRKHNKRVEKGEYDVKYLPRVGDHFILPVMGYMKVEEVVFDYTEKVGRAWISIVVD